ncbi:hypothetical protein AOLI_G00263560 [Acnodon oligacanthus]
MRSRSSRLARLFAAVAQGQRVERERCHGDPTPARSSQAPRLNESQNPRQERAFRLLKGINLLAFSTENCHLPLPLLNHHPPTVTAQAPLLPLAVLSLPPMGATLFIYIVLVTQLKTVIKKKVLRSRWNSSFDSEL